MKLSVIIPAYNEEKRLAACLENLIASLKSNSPTGLSTEIIVVDNNSTDRTSEIAHAAGVKVIFEPVNQISRARNRGAASATGDWLLFLDADTNVFPETISELFTAIQSEKHVGGTTIIHYGNVGLGARLFVIVCNTVIRTLKMTAGCFLFCRQEAFAEIGGFNEEFFAGEDAEFGKALKQWGAAKGQSLAILTQHPPLTSDRKFHLYGLHEVLLAVGRYVLFPKRTMRDKRYLDIFYDGRR